MKGKGAEVSTVAETLLTAEEFRRLPDNGVPKELVRGKVVVMNIPAPRHGYICVKIVGLLFPFVTDRQLGRLMSNDSGVVTEHNPDTVRGADVAFYSFARFPPGPLPDGYLDVIPELVFEVRSPTDRWREIRTKTTEYLDAGVITVCVLDSTTQTVHVYNNDLPDRVFKADQELTLPEVLGDFRAAVRLFFE
jgi:Uma2 family endonuclease